MWAEFFALRLWRCSGQPCNSQQSYGQMDVMVGFSRSERSRNNLGRNSNCSGGMFDGREKWVGQLASMTPKAHCHQWLLSFYPYPANCLALYLLSSMVFTATVCQVYVSGSVGTEVFVAVVQSIELRSGLRISLQSIDRDLCLPVNDFMGQEGNCQPA